MIQIIENVLSSDLADYYEREVVVGIERRGIPWWVSPNIASNEGEMDDIQFGFFHYCYGENRIINERFMWKHLNILYAACSHSNIVVDQLLAMRMFRHTPSIKPYTKNEVHNDRPEPHLACLYYYNDSDGDTYFYDDQDSEIFNMKPRKNTAVIFDGSIPHCSSTPSMHRCIINFNFTAANLNI